MDSLGGHTTRYRTLRMVKPTVRPAPSFDSRSDADALHKAMKGLGTDEKKIISILCSRSASQRHQIAQDYKHAHGKDLASMLKSELSGHFERLMIALVTPLAEFLAAEIRDAIAGLRTKEHVLIEILSTRTNEEIHKLNEAYKKLYSRDIEKDIKGDTSGDFQKLLVGLAQGQRDESGDVDAGKAIEDAQKLYKAGEGRMGTDESEFIKIFLSRSSAHIRRVCIEYESLRGHSLKKAIKSEFSGSIQEALVSIVECAENKAEYFAERLHKSVAGLGTRDDDLIRLIVSRCEIDLGDISNEYERQYKKTLQKDISGDTSGDYKKALLALIG